MLDKMIEMASSSFFCAMYCFTACRVKCFWPFAGLIYNNFFTEPLADLLITGPSPSCGFTESAQWTRFAVPDAFPILFFQTTKLSKANTAVFSFENH